MLYCIKRKISGTFLSTQGNRTRPAIMTFKTKENARNMLMFYKNCSKHNEKHQPIIIEKINPSTLAQMCNNVALDFAIMDENVFFKLAPNEKYIEILNRAYAIDL
jgi:hypothetical protein